MTRRAVARSPRPDHASVREPPFAHLTVGAVAKGHITPPSCGTCGKPYEHAGTQHQPLPAREIWLADCDCHAQGET